MRFLSTLLLTCSAYSGLALTSQNPAQKSTCRNVPGSVGYPTDAQWVALNATVSGRLVKVVPFVEFCTAQGGCTAQESASSSFRAGVPGAMNQVSTSFDFCIKSKLIDFTAKLGTGLDLPLTVVDVDSHLSSVPLGLRFRPTISL